MGYTKEQLEKLAAVMRGMPDASHSREHTKSEAVRFLSREIAALQKKGYTLQQVGEVLKNGGLVIATDTLKNYLQRLKSPSKSGSDGQGGEQRSSKARLTTKQPVVVGNAGNSQPQNGKVSISTGNENPQDKVKVTPSSDGVRGPDMGNVAQVATLKQPSTRMPKASVQTGTFVVASDSSEI